MTADGDCLLGLGNLYDAVMERLDTVSFAITTRYQRRMTLLQFWLTVVFGATEIGFIASGIAAWYYRTGLGAGLGIQGAARGQTTNFRTLGGGFAPVFVAPEGGTATM